MTLYLPIFKRANNLVIFHSGSDQLFSKILTKVKTFLTSSSSTIQVSWNFLHSLDPLEILHVKNLYGLLSALLPASAEAALSIEKWIDLAEVGKMLLSSRVQDLSTMVKINEMFI